MAHGHEDERLSHVDAEGTPRMVDVSAKDVTERRAVARGKVTISPRALKLVREGKTAKGNVIETARLAGILAAKRTSDLIPMCHPLPLDHIEVDIHDRTDGMEVEARVRCRARTGVEMEALTAVAVACLTIYDMVKALDKTMVIGEIRLLEKEGGRSGRFVRHESSDRG